MKTSFLSFPFILAFSVLPARAQCGPGHGGGHAGHGSSPSHGSHQEEPAKKVHATNTICPVMGQPVKPGRDREVVIRGNYYLVCCDGCGPEMSEHYDKYCDKEGHPLNDPQKSSDSPSKDSEKPAPAPAVPSAHEGHKH